MSESENKRVKTTRSHNKTGSVKSDIIRDLIRHFDDVKADIDYSAQNLLAKPKYCKEGKERMKIINLNIEMIKVVEKIFETNCDLVKQHFQSDECHNETIDKEEIKRKVFKSYCCFVGREMLTKFTKKKNPIGILLLTDWYLDPNQCNFIR